MRVQELEIDEGILEMRVQKISQEHVFRNHINVDIDALFEHYSTIICFVSINTS